MKKETREKKFKCPYGCNKLSKDKQMILDNCHFFGKSFEDMFKNVF